MKNLLEHRKTVLIKRNEHLAPITDDVYDAVLHEHRVRTPVPGAGHDLVQQEEDKVFVGDESPEVQAEVVGVHLEN